jgi:hypothetical protein
MMPPTNSYYRTRKFLNVLAFLTWPILFVKKIINLDEDQLATTIENVTIRQRNRYRDCFIFNNFTDLKDYAAFFSQSDYSTMKLLKNAFFFNKKVVLLEKWSHAYILEASLAHWTKYGICYEISFEILPRVL